MATKISPYRFRHSDVIRAADDSLRILRTDYIDLYQLHWPAAHVPIGETMAALDELVDRGKVRFIGVSNFSGAQLREAQESCRHRIASAQVRYNLADPVLEEELSAYCAEQEITLIAHSPLAGGLSNLRAHAPEGALERVAESMGKTLPQVALIWCLNRQNAVVIPKSDSVERIVENCGASGWTLSEEHLRLLAGDRE